MLAIGFPVISGITPESDSLNAMLSQNVINVITRLSQKSK
jgi:hypothetical protein